MPLESFKDKNIWIIGASSGIGYALAENLSAQGAQLVLSARSEEQLNELNQKLGNTHHVLPLDVADLDATQKACLEVQKITNNQIDSVILLAALYDPGPIRDMDIQKAHQMVQVNLNGTLNLVTSILPILREQKYGQLALCGSVAGYRGLPNGQPYSATKAAVMSLTESLRAEEPNLDIKLISPGFVRTPLTDKNDFDMPMIIEPEQAASALAKGLQSNAFEIHFPKKFTLILKLVRLLPAWLYFKIFTQKS
jgi:short-subunit dehydrogenase